MVSLSLRVGISGVTSVNIRRRLTNRLSVVLVSVWLGLGLRTARCSACLRTFLVRPTRVMSFPSIVVIAVFLLCNGLLLGNNAFRRRSLVRRFGLCLLFKCPRQVSRLCRLPTDRTNCGTVGLS